MKTTINIILPFLIGLAVAILLYISIGWWGFWVIFPWIGFSISMGMFVRSLLKGEKKIIGRKIAILMILPCLLIFIPIINNENFKLEGVVLILISGVTLVCAMIFHDYSIEYVTHHTSIETTHKK